MSSPPMAPPVIGRTLWTRRYPPLVTVIIALVLAVFALPSALTLPIANPGQSVEYAPVPGSHAGPAQGNLAALGLGSSSTGPGGEGGSQPGGLGGTPPDLSNVGRAPSNKHCVGTPPRQTEDPMSPPCVAFFQGDNGGATYQGVSGTEIRVLMYVTCYQCSDVTSAGIINRPSGTYYDASTGAAPGDADPYKLTAHLWQTYFNDRYQAYGRTVHLTVYWCSGDTVEARRQDAADNFNHVHPFAVIVDDSKFSNFSQDYIDAMAGFGVMNFGSTTERHTSQYSAYPKLVWSFAPSFEQHAQSFIDYVCKKVVPFPVSFSGNAADMTGNKPRTLGLVDTSDPNFPQETEFGDAVAQGIRNCGGNIATTVQFPWSNTVVAQNSDGPGYAATDIAQLRRAGVTTVIWAEGYETNLTHAAAASGYLPEWIVAGEALTSDIVTAKYQDQAAWAHAAIVTSITLTGPFRSSPCVQAELEVDPMLSSADQSIPCRSYEWMRQLFTGIQVAGPRLSPASVDQGFHAIPGHPTSDPQAPACYYDLGDYTCVKDAIPMWWDTTASSAYSSQPGCWRVPDRGQRYRASEWPGGDVKQQWTPSDTCNGFTMGQTADPSPGTDSPSPQ